MKTRSPILKRASLLLLATMPNAQAAPFTVRNMPANFDTSLFTDGLSTDAVTVPVAADFVGNGRLQWYAGGTTISGFPASGMITLPKLSLPQWSGATERPLEGIACDVDRDGDPDIVRINQWNGWGGVYTFQVFLNQGGGVFTPGYRRDWTDDPAYAEGRHCFRIAPGDFNGDGAQDIAVVESYDNPNHTTSPSRVEGKLYIRWNDGTGAFPASTTLIGTGVQRDSRLAVADFDRDGDSDIYCVWLRHDNDDNGTWEESGALLKNNGQGGFAPPLKLSWWNHCLAVDLNRDGWLDLASLEARLNDGAGGFLEGYIPPGDFQQGVCFTDLNGDGYPDRIGPGIGGRDLSYQLNGITTQSIYPMCTVSDDLIEIATADSDADGDNDFLAVLRNGACVFIENTELHRATGADLQGTLNFSGVTRLEAGDFNLDGRDDLVALSPSQQRIGFFYGEDDGIPAAPLLKATQSVGAADMAVGDFDRNGRPDVAYALAGTGQVRIVSNTSNLPLYWADSLVAGMAGVSRLTTGEIGTPNGAPDLLACNGASGELRWFYRAGNSWLGQTVRSGFTAPVLGIMAADASLQPGDEPFILAADSSAVFMQASHLNPGWQAYGTDHSSPATPGVSPIGAMAWTDATGDGKKEAVLVNGAGQLIYWKTSNGGGNGAIGTSSGNIRDFKVVDWNRDGRMDFLCATATGVELVRWQAGAWTKDTLASRAGGYSSLALIDLNNNGVPDCAAADPESGEIKLLMNHPNILDVTFLSSAGQNLAAGTSGPGMNLTVKSFGRVPAAGDTFSAEPSAMLRSVRVGFHRVEGTGSNLTTGSPLTKSELSAIVTSISLVSGDTVIGSVGPGALEPDGTVEVSYNSILGNEVLIPPGATQSRRLRLTVRADAMQAPLTQFFIVPAWGTAYSKDGRERADFIPIRRLGGSRQLITIKPNYSALEEWRITYFGSPEGEGPAANEADYDADGVSNLIEYALGTDPSVAEPALNAANALTLLPFPSVTSPVRSRLVLSTAAMNDAHLRLTIQVSTNTSLWNSLTSRTGGGAWQGLPPQFAIPSGNGTTLTFSIGLTPQAMPRLYLRLKAEELP